MKQEITLPFDVSLPSVTHVGTGALSCLYEQGNLRTIRVGDLEIIRMIYGAVRDEHWNTASYEIKHETIQATAASFSISYVAFYQLDDIRYKAQFHITGAGNVISVEMRGEALTSFKRNRIGLCVLHPIEECAGKNVVVIKKDGTSYSAPFPTTISPHQPFFDIQEMHFAINNLQVQLQFEGDVFETEDQRNWTDSSFKTYSTPLRLPFPVLVKKGETMHQKVTLLVSGEAAPNKKESEQGTAQKVPFPKIGFSRNAAHGVLKKFEIDLLKRLPFHHYRIELHLADPAWTEALQQATTEAQLLNTTLELVVFFAAAYEAELKRLIAELQKVAAPVFSILLLSSTEKATPKALLQNAYTVLKQTFSKAHIGYGTSGNFADLNRARPEETPHDFVSFRLHPQVHASDTRSILENLETQHHTLQTIRTFTDKPVHVAITFAARGGADARQQTSLAAWWTLKTLQNLSSAACLTFYQTTGAAGVLPTTEFEKPVAIYDVFQGLKIFNPAWAFEKVGAPAVYEPVVVENSAGDLLQFRLQQP